MRKEKGESIGEEREKKNNGEEPKRENEKRKKKRMEERRMEESKGGKRRKREFVFSFFLSRCSLSVWNPLKFRIYRTLKSYSIFITFNLTFNYDIVLACSLFIMDIMDV